jgi:glycosyltransferase involved in cell wall biosynthesis
LRVTVAIPCFNEAPTIAKVVADFRAQLPEAEIVVFDNASTDGSGERAREAGRARRAREAPRQGLRDADDPGAGRRRRAA